MYKGKKSEGEVGGKGTKIAKKKYSRFLWDQTRSNLKKWTEFMHVLAVGDKRGRDLPIQLVLHVFQRKVLPYQISVQNCIFDLKVRKRSFTKNKLMRGL